MKYEVIFKKYWSDRDQTTEKKHFNTVREILEYVYSVYEDSIGFNRSFQCKGNGKHNSGYLNAGYSLQNEGDLWLMRITYISAEQKKLLFLIKIKDFAAKKLAMHLMLLQSLSQKIKRYTEK